MCSCRERLANPTCHLKSINALIPSPAAEETALTLYHEACADMTVNSVRSSENSTSIENDFSSSTLTHLMIEDTRENGLTLASPHESQDQLVHSLSTMFLVQLKKNLFLILILIRSYDNSFRLFVFMGIS